MSNYFEFSESEKRYLESINEDFDRNLSPYATKNSDAIRRIESRRYDIIRPAYSYDTDSIIHNPLYNRYADKTQVFSFYRNDDLTRRALHVQFVSKVAKTIGRALRLNQELIEAMALGHDMGHTPFGHKGEEYLSECYGEGTLKRKGVRRYFNHNVHSARIFRHILKTNLTLQTLSGIISHNGEKVCKEYAPSKLDNFGDFDILLENCYTDNDYHKTLRPNTLEGCVVRVSDMIAYAGKDRQDLNKTGLVPADSFKKDRLIGTKNRDIISNMVINIIKNSIDSPSLNMDEEVFNDLRDLISENYRIIYGDDRLNAPYEEGVKPLMKGLYARLTDDLLNENKQSPVYRHYLNDYIMGSSYKDEQGNITGDVDDIVCDFIASMTDDYFVDICKELHIDDEAIKKLKYHEYFEK